MHPSSSWTRGPERRIRNKVDGWIYGTEAAPNSRGAEAAGLTRAKEGDGSALSPLPSSLLRNLRLLLLLLPSSSLYLRCQLQRKVQRPRIRRGSAPGERSHRPRPHAQRPDGRRRHRPAGRAALRQGRHVREREGPRAAHRHGHRVASRRAHGPRGAPAPRQPLERVRRAVDGPRRVRKDAGRPSPGTPASRGIPTPLVGNPPSISPAAAYDVLGLERDPGVEVFPRPSVAAPDRRS